MSLTFLHAADIHLDSPLHGLRNYPGAPVDAIRLATREAFKKLVRLAIERCVGCVVLSGDLYDGDWRDYNTGLFFVAQAQKLRDAGIPLVLIAGNHDAQNIMTRSLPLPEGVTLLDSRQPQTLRFDDLGLAIHGQSFAERAVTADLSLGYPPAIPGLFNIGLLHTSVNGREGHDHYAPCTIAGLKTRGYQYWGLGHVHQREVLFEEPWITFSGNLQGRHIRETGPKGCWLIEVDQHLKAQPTFIPLDVFRWELVECGLTTEETEDDVWELVSRQLRQYAEQADLPTGLRVRITGTTPLHEYLLGRRDMVTSHVQALGLHQGAGKLWIEKVKVETQTVHRPGRTSHDFESPAEELAGFMRELRSDPAALAELGSEIKALSQKMPADLVGPQPTGLLVGWEELLDEAAALLTDRLSRMEQDG